jgi:hypothetical protein
MPAVDTFEYYTKEARTWVKRRSVGLLGSVQKLIVQPTFQHNMSVRDKLYAATALDDRITNLFHYKNMDITGLDSRELNLQQVQKIPLRFAINTRGRDETVGRPFRQHNGEDAVDLSSSRSRAISLPKLSKLLQLQQLRNWDENTRSGFAKNELLQLNQLR